MVIYFNMTGHPRSSHRVWAMAQDEEIIVFLAALRKHGIYSEWFRYVLTLPMQDANCTLSWQPEEAMLEQWSLQWWKVLLGV